MSSPAIILATLNAKYIHTSFGLRYLKANLCGLSDQAQIEEFTISDVPLDIATKILKHKAKIIGFGVYIWNTTETLEVLKLIKTLSANTTTILGGPEVSYETETQEIIKYADYVITGEADHAFRELCEKILAGEKLEQKIIKAPIPDVKTLVSPYHLYSEIDLKQRVIYVEMSRGCPFTCEFCLSSLNIPVRQVDIDKFLVSMQDLIDRGATQFKFVDRTFNVNFRVSKRILEFFLQHYKPGMFFHFEMIPDRFPEQLKETVRKFPAGSLQFEVGIQSFNPEVGVNISRKQDFSAIEQNFKFLAEETGVHVHADLIIGLPGESLESFGQGFDRLLSMKPQEIQVGILKRLKGTPIIRHDTQWQMCYSPLPPFEILHNKLLDFETMAKLRRFARFWDLVGNSGNFVLTRELIWREQKSAFFAFLEFSEWIYLAASRTDSISLVRLTRYLGEFLQEVRKVDTEEILLSLRQDFARTGRKEDPVDLVKRETVKSEKNIAFSPVNYPPRQSRHFTGAAPVEREVRR